MVITQHVGGGVVGGDVVGEESVGDGISISFGGEEF